MIPKVIHVCSFGSPKSTPLLDMCHESWTRLCPDFTVRVWNDESFDPYRNAFFDEAISQRKFAFASDYARAFVLNTFGGVYLDTDVELRGSLAPFLVHSAFTGFERVGYPFTAVWGSEAGHRLAKTVSDYYQKAPFSTVTNTSIVSQIIEREFGINRGQDRLQIGADGLAIYPSSTFCVDIPGCTAVHHFAGSWVEGRNGRMPHKTVVLILHYANRIDELGGLDSPAMFSFIRRRFGASKYMFDFVSNALRNYVGSALRAIGLR